MSKQKNTKKMIGVVLPIDPRSQKLVCILSRGRILDLPQVHLSHKHLSLSRKNVIESALYTKLGFEGKVVEIVSFDAKLDDVEFTIYLFGCEIDPDKITPRKVRTKLITRDRFYKLNKTTPVSKKVISWLQQYYVRRKEEMGEKKAMCFKP